MKGSLGVCPYVFTSPDGVLTTMSYVNKFRILDRNELAGTLPASIGRLTNLEELHASKLP